MDVKFNERAEILPWELWRDGELLGCYGTMGEVEDRLDFIENCERGRDDS